MVSDRVNKHRVIVTLFILMFFGPVSLLANPQTGIKNVSLVSDVEQLEAGGSFLLGVRFEIADGWHVYWKNPGDFGVAPEVEFKTPEGFTVGDLRWPTPERFLQRNDVVGYGYSKEVILSAPVVSDAEGAVGRNVSFTADVRWLACNPKRCVPGEASVKASVRVRNKRELSHESLFELHNASIPDEWSSESELAEVSIAGSLVKFGGSGEFEINYKWKKPVEVLDWFAADISGLTVQREQFETESNVTEVRVRAVAAPGVNLGREQLETVISFKDADGNIKGLAYNLSLKN